MLRPCESVTEILTETKFEVITIGLSLRNSGFIALLSDWLFRYCGWRVCDKPSITGKVDSRIKQIKRHIRAPLIQEPYPDKQIAVCP
jgi:hypothetical protein